VLTPTQATPYSLVYGSEIVVPLEVQLPHHGLLFMKELAMMNKPNLDFKSFMRQKKDVFKPFKILSYIAKTW
jgi:predicted ATPase with chaperone activity